MGGVGKVIGAVIGAFIMGVMNNGMSIMGVGIDWQQVIKGLVLLALWSSTSITRTRPEPSSIAEGQGPAWQRQGLWHSGTNFRPELRIVLCWRRVFQRHGTALKDDSKGLIRKTYPQGVF